MPNCFWESEVNAYEVCSVPPPVFNFVELQKITGSAVAFVSFAVETHIDGDYAIVSCMQTQEAFIYFYSGGSWALQQILTPTVADEGFASAVAISGEYAAVTVHGGARVGAVYIFKRVGATWTQQQHIISPIAPVSNAQFGREVVIEGDTVVVSAPYEDLGYGFDQAHGALYVFRRVAETWSLEQKLLPLDITHEKLLGYSSIGISGDTIIANCARSGHGEFPGQGACYVWVRSGVSWTQQQKIIGSGADYDNFGSSVAIAGDRIIVGASYTNGNSGVCYAFHRSAGVWTETQTLFLDVPAATNYFGASVAMDGDYAVISAPFWDLPILPPYNNAGCAQVFYQEGGVGPWVTLGPILSPPVRVSTDDRLGESLDISGNHIVLANANDDTLGFNRGAVHFYRG